MAQIYYFIGNIVLQSYPFLFFIFLAVPLIQAIHKNLKLYLLLDIIVQIVCLLPLLYVIVEGVRFESTPSSSVNWLLLFLLPSCALCMLSNFISLVTNFKYLKNQLNFVKFFKLIIVLLYANCILNLITEKTLITSITIVVFGSIVFMLLSIYQWYKTPRNQVNLLFLSPFVGLAL